MILVSTDGMRVTWSPGRRPLYQRPGNRNFSFLNVASGEEEPLVADEDRGWVFAPQYSPDGEQLALFWNRPPDQSLWLVTREPYAERVVTKDALDPIGWSPDGKWIFVIRKNSTGGDVGRVPAVGGDLEVLFTVPGDVRLGSVDASGTKIVVPVSVEQSDAFVVENFDRRQR